MKRNKFVLDVNVWVSFILGKQLAWLTKIVQSNKIELVSCAELYNELKEVLSRPKFEKYISQTDIKEALILHSKLTKQVKNIKIVSAFADSDDDYLLALALKAKAIFIVTGDKLLLNKLVPESISIITLTQFNSIVL